MTDLKAIASKYQKLKTEWGKNNRNWNKIKEMLEELKLSLVELNFLPTSEEGRNEKELILARDILEIGAQYCVEKDVPSFERYMAQLKTYYSDYDLPESPYKFELLGLNLLRLLSENRLAEFHIELELLPRDALLTNPYIRNPVALEQCIMEGTYNKILIMKDNVPSPSYAYFIEILLFTIRHEIGSCLEKAYERISTSECSKMLYLKDGEILAYAKERGWDVRPDKFVYFKALDKKSCESQVPTLELAKMAITYAKEMEQIV